MKGDGARGGDGGERGKATLIGYPERGERGECSLAAFAALLMRGVTLQLSF